MDSSTTTREVRLQETIAGFLDAVASGQTPDREQLLPAHPDLADDLRAFFADHDKMTQAAAPVRVALADEPTPASAPAEQFPQPFGDYELLEEIGRGGMGVVYKARQISLNRIVALKRIRTGQLASPDEVARFRREAEAAAGLDHPHIVPIYEVGEHAGQHYFTMKLIEGGHLNAHLTRFGDAKTTAELMIKIAQAVHHAHQRGILHRDLKPGNILIDAEGQPHVSDFGLAQPIEKEAKLTQSGAIVGTAEYMAPEQARGQKGLTTAADVYGLGAILYVLLTGRPPFQGDYNWETLKKVVEEEPVSPRSIKGQTNRDLEAICLKCLEKAPARRYGAAEALANELQAWLDGKPIEARRASVSGRMWKWMKRRPARAGLALAVVALLVFGAVLFQQNRDMAYWSELATSRKTAWDAEAKLAQEQGNRAKVQAKLAQEREWFLLLNQARSERLGGNRQEALAHLKKLAALTGTEGTPGDPVLLHEEAFLAINTTGAMLLRELDVGNIHEPWKLSPDGSYLLLDGRGDRKGTVRCMPLSAGEPVVQSPTIGGDFLAEWVDSKQVRILTWNKEYLWNPRANKILGEKQRMWWPEGIQVSPKGTWQAQLGYSRYWKSAERKDPDSDIEGKVPFRKVSGRFTKFLDEARALVVEYSKDDQEIRGLSVWDLEKNEKLSEVTCSTWESLTPQRLLCVAGQEVFVWDPLENKKVLSLSDATLISHKQATGLVAVRPKDKPGALQTWDLERGELLGEMGNSAGLDFFLDKGTWWNGRWLVAPNGPRISESHFMSGSWRGGAVRGPACRVCDLRSGDIQSLTGLHGERVNLSFLPGSGLLLVVPLESSDYYKEFESMYLWDLNTQEVVATMTNPDLVTKDPGGHVSRLVGYLPFWSVDGRVVATLCLIKGDKGQPANGNGIRAWNIVHPNPTYPGTAARRLEFSADGKFLAVNNELWKVVPGGDLAYLQPSARTESKESPRIFFGPEGKMWEVYPPTEARGTRIVARHSFALSSSEKEWQLPAPRKGLVAEDVVISPTGKYAVETNRWFVTVYDLSKELPSVTWFHQFSPSKEKKVLHPVFISDEAFQISTENEHHSLRYLHTFHVPSRRCQYVSNQEAQDKTSAWNFPRSAAIAKVSAGHIFFTDGRPRVRLEGNPPSSLVLSADDRFLAGWSGKTQSDAGNVVHLWDTKTGKLVLRWKAHDDPVDCLAFSPDGALLATGDRRGVKLWNLDFVFREKEKLGLSRSWPMP